MQVNVVHQGSLPDSELMALIACEFILQIDICYFPADCTQAKYMGAFQLVLLSGDKCLRLSQYVTYKARCIGFFS